MEGCDVRINSLREVLTGKIQENTINIFIKKGILLIVSLIRSSTSGGSSHDLIKKLPLLWASWLMLPLFSGLDD